MVPDRRDGDPGEPSLVELVFPHDVADGLPHIVESLLEILGGQIIGGKYTFFLIGKFISFT